MALAMQVAKLLTEIAVDLFDSNHERPVTNIKDKNYIALHNKSQRSVFGEIRVCRYDKDPQYLRNSNMASLIEILPLAAMYNCSSVLGPKIAYFLAQLNSLKSKPGFIFAEWLNIDMLQIYQIAPLIFISPDDINYHYTSPHSSGGSLYPY